MDSETTLRRYRSCYAVLLRLYPGDFYKRFAAEMEQTFNDVLRERAQDGRSLVSYTLWVFAETTLGIFKTRMTHAMAHHKNIIRLALVVAALLMVPAIAMQFTDEVKWGPEDFVFAGTLLFGTGLAYELLRRRVAAQPYRLGVGLALLGSLFLVWVNAAVGIIGTEGNPANLMYAGVLAVGAVGAALSRFRPLGLARALMGMAAAQAVVAAIVLVRGLDGRVVLDAFFCGVWVAASLLCRRAERMRNLPV
jgi:hypothetical protein